jgi:hypothetical protein
MFNGAVLHQPVEQHLAWSECRVMLDKLVLGVRVTIHPPARMCGTVSPWKGVDESVDVSAKYM